MLMDRQAEIIERIKEYDSKADLEAVARAYAFAARAHGDQKRASGDLYFTHPIEVANILIDMKMDSASIMTAFLHDTVEDTGISLDDIETEFGEEVAKLVDGVTKLSQIELQSDSTKQAENFRKLVLAMSEDIRVLLVKLADRLHNMRTLHHIKKPEKRVRIAKETMEIYAPLAQRMGINEMKDELEDLAFSEMNGDARESIIARLEFLRLRGTDLVGRIIDEFRTMLNEEGVQCLVSGREKTPYSIWQKMQRKNVGFEQLSDIMAFRITLDSIGDCYHTLGILHSAYPVVPARFKDYISTPKANGYQSLHTTVIGPEQQRIEVQIRTKDMHEIAELGVAAHWIYKDIEAQASGRDSEGKQYRWLRELLDILEFASGPAEFLEHTKLEMFQDQVFCFTPKGDLISLPKGGTPVDFAYAVHSGVGNTTVGAKINGRIMPLKTELQNGDQVEIVTSKAQTPSPSWEQFVITGKAKAAIRRFVRSQQRQQYSDLGKAMLQKVYREEGVQFSPGAFDEKFLMKMGCHEVEELFAKVGEGSTSPIDVITEMFPSSRRKKAEEDQQKKIEREENKLTSLTRRKGGTNTNHIPINGLIPGMAVHFARCCHPLPGDRIVGIVTTGKGVTVHTIDCDTLQSFSDQPERWIDISWDMDQPETNQFIGRVRIILVNSPGTMGSLTTVIGKSDGNITNLKIVNRAPEFFEVIVDVEVNDVKHLTEIVAALRASPDITQVDRLKR